MTNKEMNISLKAEVEQLKDDNKKLNDLLTIIDAINDIPNLSDICKAVKYIGQAGYVMNKYEIIPVKIINLKINDSVWLRTNNHRYLQLSDINNRLFFGENAKEQAEEKYNELTAQSKGE